MIRPSGTLISAAVLILIVVAVLVIAVSLTGGVPATGFLFGQQTATPQPGSGSGSPYAKNVILMIGDGMGRNQTEAARWEKSGNDMATYRSTSLAMDGLDYTGNISTASANSAVTDSAAGATALMTGIRTDNGVIGQDETAVKGVSDGARLTTIAEPAKAKGRATGVVTTSRVTDATPAGVYAHVNDRDDEVLIAGQSARRPQSTSPSAVATATSPTTPGGIRGRRRAGGPMDGIWSPRPGRKGIQS